MLKLNIKSQAWQSPDGTRNANQDEVTKAHEYSQVSHLPFPMDCTFLAAPEGWVCRAVTAQVPSPLGRTHLGQTFHTSFNLRSYHTQ